MNNSLESSMIDPRFTYDRRWGKQILDRKSAYMNTLLALEDLSTKGWTPTLKWEAQYSLPSYQGVTIRIHASQNPSTLQYRHAIWGLYLAIRESSANGFQACLLSLYWSSQLGATPQILGYVSLLREVSPAIDSNNSTWESPDLATPTRAISPGPVPANLTTAINDSTSLTTGMVGTHDLKIETSLLAKELDVDAVFHTIYAGEVYLASWPQSKRVDKPGLIRDDVSRTFLRWDSSHLTVQPTFEYRYVIAALARLPAYMYEQNRFRDARFVVYVDEIEVGRGWLYSRGLKGASSAE